MLIRSCCISHRDFNLHMTWQRRCIVSVIALFCVTCSMRANESCLSSIHFTNGATSAPLPGVIRNEKSHVFISARIIGHDEELRFVFDTGAGRTVIDRRVAARLGLKATEKSSVGGVDVNLVDDIHESEGTAGIIGYDLLCANVVTLDDKKPSIVVTAPSAYQYHGVGDVLPLSFNGRWPYVRGVLKVPGVDPVTDDFLIDTGSEDAVNHPVIRQSKGPLRETNTGAGGVGQSLRGVVGPNEWSRIGSTTIPATKSACCAGNDDVNRQLGSAILSHFRIMFNYPARQIILEKN